jgi:septum formation protein
VAEDGTGHLPPAEAVLTLSRRKAAAVAAQLPAAQPALVVGGDSLLELEGRARGKPASASEAAAFWRQLRNRTGNLHTGHCVIDTAQAREVAETDTALVRFGDPTDTELDAYIATGEPLEVAGAFTLEGYGAAWVTSIDGNPGTVMGLSIPVLRRLLCKLGLELVDLWTKRARADA